MAVQLAQISLSYGADEVLQDVSATLADRERVALVGRNGAGKTTLLRILAGELRPDGGEVALPGGTRVALHDQRPPLRTSATLGSYVGAGAQEAAGLEDELRRLEAQMAAGDLDAATLRRYDRAQHEFELAGGYAWRAQLESVARGLGFTPEDLPRPLETFSGGELTRASLARALAGDPDLLLLDEPTNHLDLAAIEWLEGYLQSLAATVVLVSHDRWFLESVATAVLEIDRGRGRALRGSYSSFRRQRALDLAYQAELYEQQQRELAHLQRFVDRFRYGTKARQAQSKLKAMDRIARVERPSEQRSLRFEFPPPPRSGRVVLEARALDVEVAGRRLVSGATFHVERGQRVALVGRNGAGKTTLLETLLGRRASAGGSASMGHGVSTAYYSQQSLELPDAARLTEAVSDGTGLTRQQARSLLGLFLFSGDEVEKPVAALSGGERRRLALARLVVSGANLLVLDEPTNHLDVESREALEDALLAFPGTILFVSHDRALIETLATRTLSLADGRLRLHEGAVVHPEAEPEPPRPTGHAPKQAAPGRATARAKREPRPRRPSQRAAREAARLEARIGGLEDELGAVQARLSQPDAYADPGLVAEDGRRHQELQEELAWLYREWERHAAEAG